MLTFQEIESWARQTGRILTGWEVETLRKLSNAYLAESQDAGDETKPPPWMPADKMVNRDVVADRLSAILDQFEAQDATMGLGERARQAQRSEAPGSDEPAPGLRSSGPRQSRRQ